MTNTHTEELQESEINELNKTIQQWEDIDPLFMHEEIRELRHRIMFIHANLEPSLAILLGRYVMEAIKEIVPRETRQLIMQRFQKVGGTMEFAPKVNLVQELNLISGKMKNKLFTVNNLRIAFSHPVSHETEIRGFLERKKYLAALKTLKDAHEAMNDAFREIEKTEKKETKSL